MPLQLDDPKAKGNLLISLIEDDIRERQPAIRMRHMIRNLYYGINLRKKRYAGQSDIHLYVLAEKVENTVAKELNAFMAIEPHVHVENVPPMVSPLEAKQAERISNWAVDTDIPDFYRTFEGWLRNRHLDSVAAVKVWYNFEQRHTVVLDDAETMWQTGESDFTGEEIPQPRLKVPAEVLGSVFTAVFVNDARRGKKKIDVTEEQELEGLSFDIDFAEGNLDYAGIRVEFRPHKERDVITVASFRPVTIKDNVEVDLVEFEDLVVPSRTRDLQSAERIAQKYWLTPAELKTKIMHDGWDISESEYSVLKNRGRSERQGREEVPQEYKRLKEQKDLVVGVRGSQSSSRASEEAFDDSKILIFEVYAREDLSGDGIFTEVIYQIPYGLKKVVHAQYLEEVFPHGRRPFADLYSIPISNRYYGWSLGQILAPVNLEVDSIINQVNDAQELINNPIFFYVPTALHGDEKQYKNLRPGQGLPVNDINGVMFPKFQQQPLANLSMIDSILVFADRMTITPQASGTSQVRNAPRTARGTLAMLGEAAIKVDNYITAAQKGGWSELMYQIYTLYDAFATGETWEAVTGAPKAHRTSKDLRDRVKFRFKGNTVNTNRQVTQSMAQVIYNTLMTNPLYATDPQALRNVTEFFLRAFHDGGDIESLLPQLPPGMARRPMIQREEIELMKMGMPIDVLPGDNDIQHIKDIEVFQNSKAFGEWTDFQVGFLAAHTLQHQRQMQIKAQQGAMQPGATQANNVPQGITQDLNVLEGGVQ